MFSVGGMAHIGEWSRFNNQGQTFPREDSFSLGCSFFSAEGMAQIGEWSRFNNQGHGFLRADSFFLGCTFFSARGMAQGGEWSRLINQDNYSSLLEKNSPYISSLMFDLLREDALLRSHICELENGPDNLVYIITLFLCRLISDDCYEDCMSLDNRCILLWWMCSTIVTIRH